MARRPRVTSGATGRAAAGGPPPAVSHVPSGPTPVLVRALRAGLLALVAARVALVFVPGRPLWGYDLLRDLAAPAAWLPLILTLLAFVPAIGRGVERAWARTPNALGVFALVGAVGLAGFLWAHPDRALYNGDTSLRHGMFATSDHPEQFAEQALRGDLVLHHDLPAALGGHTLQGAETVNRAMGVVAALLSLLAAWALARALEARGLAGATVIAVGLATGALALFNGYGKATVELAVLTLVIAAGLVHVARARDGAAKGLVGIGLAVAAALLLHRSAVALLPAWLAGVGLALTAGLPRRTADRFAFAVGVVAPLGALAVVLPRLMHVVGAFDTSRHLHGGLGAALAFACTPGQLADAGNALGILLPIVPLLPVLLALGPRPSRRESLAWAALVLPLVALLLLASPQHGLPRDWDVFVCVGVALAALTATRLAAWFEAEPRTRTLALAVGLVALVPALQWVALQADAARAWTRAEAVLLGPPPRSATERAYGFDTIGMLCLGRGQTELARRMFERSAEAAPNPSTFVRMGMAETMLGRPADAMTHYRHAASLDPDLVTAWRGVAAAASATGDRTAMEDAVRNMTRLEPGNPLLVDARAWLAADDSLRRVARH